MTETELAVVGGGPAGLSAAAAASRLGVEVLLLDDNPRLGGQLVKQTHKFFGSRSLYCGMRGMDIAGILAREALEAGARVITDAPVVGLYPGRVLGTANRGRFERIQPRAVIMATGASENSIAFPGNDLPGVIGGGAIQTMMNVYGVRPGRRVLMVGAGNIGLIVSYQLTQSGIAVAAVVEALPQIGGYHVHAAKLARLGVPILTRHTIVKALGRETVSGAVIARLSRQGRLLLRTRRNLDVDTICLAVGLTPLSELLIQAGCRMAYVPELGGNVAWHDEDMHTSIPGVFVAGDLAGVEEASTAMLEGRLAGLAAAEFLMGQSDEIRRQKRAIRLELACVRQGPFAVKTCAGKDRLSACRPDSAAGR